MVPVCQYSVLSHNNDGGMRRVTHEDFHKYTRVMHVSKVWDADDLGNLSWK